MSIKARIDRIETQSMGNDCPHCTPQWQAFKEAREEPIDEVNSLDDGELKEILQELITPCVYCLKPRTFLELVCLVHGITLIN